MQRLSKDFTLIDKLRRRTDQKNSQESSEQEDVDEDDVVDNSKVLSLQNSRSNSVHI
jgi:hypothetical protein